VHKIRHRNVVAFNEGKQMRKGVHFIIVAACMAIFAGCASTTQYVPLPDQSQRIEDPSKARIYVVRPTAFGGVVTFKVNDGDMLIGKTGPNGYLCWERPSGQMEVIGKAENTSRLPVDVEQGTVYYIQQHVRMGIMSARNELSLLSETEGKSKVSKCKPPKVLIPGRSAAEKAEPESEQPKVEPEKPKPVEVSPAPDRLLRRNTYSIGPELYSFEYEEPGYMEEEGMFYGVAFGYTYRGWVPDSPEQSFSDNKMMARLEGRFALGEVDYDGATQDPTTGEIIPITINGIDDFALEGRLLLGPEWLGENALNTLYAGIAYRYLNDDLAGGGPGGYVRESNYFYVPIGFEIDTNIQADWSWGGRIEYDYFVWGLQRSHLSDIYPLLPDVDNDQESGYGYRASIKLQYKSTDVIFAIEPFFRYWDIDKSKVELGSVFEPANETTEFGIQLTWMF